MGLGDLITYIVGTRVPDEITGDCVRADGVGPNDTDESNCIQIGKLQVGIGEIGSCKSCAREIRTKEIGSGEVGLGKVGIAEVGQLQVGSGEITTLQIRPYPK